MSSSSSIAPSAEAANHDQCSDDNSIFIIGEASPPIVLDLIDSEPQMPSQNIANTTKGSTQCRGQNQDGSQCKRPNITTTKQWQKELPKEEDKTEEDKRNETLCKWCINKNRKDRVEGDGYTDQSAQATLHNDSDVKYEDPANDSMNGDESSHTIITEDQAIFANKTGNEGSSNTFSTSYAEQLDNVGPLPRGRADDSSSTGISSENSGDEGKQAPLDVTQGGTVAAPKPSASRRPQTKRGTGFKIPLKSPKHVHSPYKSRKYDGRTSSIPANSIQVLEMTEMSEQLQFLARQMASLHNQVSIIGEIVNETRQLLDCGQKKADHQRQNHGTELRVIRGKAENIGEAMVQLDATLSSEFGRLREEVYEMGKLFDQPHTMLLEMLTEMADALRQLRISHPPPQTDKGRQDLKTKIDAQFELINKAKAKAKAERHTSRSESHKESSRFHTQSTVQDV